MNDSDYNTKQMIIKVFNKKGEEESCHSFKQKQVILGRNPKVQNSILIDSESVSRSHLKISIKNNQLRAQDLNSSNGTFINGEQIAKGEKISVSKNDKITLGELKGYVTVQVRQEQGKKKAASSQSSSESQQRERSRQKSTKKDSSIQIAQSTLKMLRSMTADRKSKAERVKFLKLMGYGNAQQNWEEIEEMINRKKTYFLSNANKKASEQLQKQFSLSRSGHEKKGLGR